MAPGTLSVGGTYIQSENGSLQIELSSPALFGMLDITAKAVFAPGTTLDFDFVDFTPTEGETFTFLTAKGGVDLLSSDFNCGENVFTCNFSGVPAGLEFEVESRPEALTLVTLNSVSEPTTLGILGASLVMLAGLRRRRQHETLLPASGS